MLNSNILAAALKLANAVFPVFPCHPGNKQPLVKGGFKAAIAAMNEAGKGDRGQA
jgi:hypothetical protein